MGIAVTSCVSAADLNLLDARGDLQLLEEDAQFLVRVKTDYHNLGDSDANLSEEGVFVTLDISEGIQSPRSRDIAICRKRCLCVAMCTTSSLVISAIIYVVNRWNSA